MTSFAVPAVHIPEWFKPVLLALVSGLVGWWVAYYFQSAKIFFDSKRTACEKLIDHFSSMFALASRWAGARAQGLDANHLISEFNSQVEQTWPLLCKLTLYAPPRIARMFIKTNYELIQFMDRFDTDEKSKNMLMQKGKDWQRYVEKSLFPRISSIRRGLIMSVLLPWF